MLSLKGLAMESLSVNKKKKKNRIIQQFNESSRLKYVIKHILNVFVSILCGHAVYYTKFEDDCLLSY